MNINFEEDGKRFQLRSSAIIYNEDKTHVLLFTGKDRDFWLLPGGKVELTETSENAIKRELIEELGWEIDFELSTIEESILLFCNIHTIEFIYKGIYNKKIQDESFNGLEDDWQIFKWFKLEELNNCNLKPSSVKEIIKDVNNNDLKHIVEVIKEKS